MSGNINSNTIHFSFPLCVLNFLRYTFRSEIYQVKVDSHFEISLPLDIFSDFLDIIKWITKSLFLVWTRWSRRKWSWPSTGRAGPPGQRRWVVEQHKMRIWKLETLFRSLMTRLSRAESSLTTSGSGRSCSLSRIETRHYFIGKKYNQHQFFRHYFHKTDYWWTISTRWRLSSTPRLWAGPALTSPTSTGDPEVSQDNSSSSIINVQECISASMIRARWPAWSTTGRVTRSVSCPDIIWHKLT